MTPSPSLNSAPMPLTVTRSPSLRASREAMAQLDNHEDEDVEDEALSLH